MIFAAAGFFDFRTMLEQWASIGFFDVLLPFFIMFAVIYAILQKSKILGSLPAIDAVISCAISFFVIGNPYVTALFLPIFSQAGLALAILVAVMVIVGLFIGEQELGKFKTILALAGIGLFLWLLGRMSNTYGIWLFPQDFLITNGWIIPTAIFAVGIIGIVISSSFGKGKAPSAPQTS